MSAKRPAGSNGQQNQKKKFKVASGFLDPGTSGIYATVARRKERQAAQELGLLFEEKVQEMYGDKIKEMNDEKTENNGSDNEAEEVELSIEEQINQELSEMRSSEKTKTKDERKKDLLQFIDLNCECVIFCKTRRPIVPEDFVQNIMDDLVDPSNKVKRTRYVHKLTPITYSCNATMEQILKLAEQVIAPHFHTEEAESDKGLKFAIEVSRRNFNTIPKMDIINNLVSFVCEGGKYKHTVDLKNYDKLILVECFKSNVGISVVSGEYNKCYKKYNVQQIYEAKFKDEDDEKPKETEVAKSEELEKVPEST